MEPIRYTAINHLAILGRPGYRQYFFENSPFDIIAFFEWPEVEPVPEKGHGVPHAGPLGFDHVAISPTPGMAAPQTDDCPGRPCELPRGRNGSR